MKLEEQVLSIEQMQHLKELGVMVKDTAMCWVKPNEHCQWDKSTDGSSSEYHILQSGMVHDYLFSEIVPTLTLQEILQILPKKFSSDGIVFEFDMGYSELYGYKLAYIIKQRSIFDNIVFVDENPLVSAYNMLCWVAEHGYLNKSASTPLNEES